MSRDEGVCVPLHSARDALVTIYWDSGSALSDHHPSDQLESTDEM